MLLKFEDMTTEQKLGMVFCARRFQPEDVDFIIEMLKKRALGCIQVPYMQPDIIKKLLDAADYPVLCINDTEQGFTPANLPRASLASLSACDNPEYFKSFAKGIAVHAKAAGLNGTWGPVLDILTVDAPCKVGRCFSSDPEKIVEKAAIIAQVFKDNGFLSTGKHFPGGTDVGYDTHMAEGVSNLTEEELLKQDIYPYIELNKRGLLPCIMTTHTVFKNIDPDYPASLSKKCIDIIRKQGFDGVAFTDSLAMMGILQKYGEENAYGLAVSAGNDIVLPNLRTSVKDAFNMFVHQYELGIITDERLDEATRRVLKAMEFVAAEPANPSEFTEQDFENLKNVSRDCVTAVLDNGVNAKLDGKNEDKLFIVITNGPAGDLIEQEISEKPGWYSPTLIGKTIEAEFPGAGLGFLPEFPTSGENEKILTLASNYREVIFMTYCDSPCYLGTDSMTKRVEAVINCLSLSGKVSTVCHFGSPYALKSISHIKRKIFGYKNKESQKYAVEVLSGKLEAKGKLPYNVEFQ
ncbi:MAG: hypothetical protein IKU43_00490 [Clostridia bacterium]|nr:hypothetical protein [Clostridia bacterium]